MPASGIPMRILHMLHFNTLRIDLISTGQIKYNGNSGCYFQRLKVISRTGVTITVFIRRRERASGRPVHVWFFIEIRKRVGSMKHSSQRMHTAWILGVMFTVLLCIPATALTVSSDSSGYTTLALAPSIAAKDAGGDPAYHTICRCAPEPNEFCQGTLNDTDIFLSADGNILHGSETSTCRLIWEYEFSAPIEKLAVDTTSQNIYFSSNETVYALSLSRKELIYSQEMSDKIRNISLQPGDRLSIDLVNGDRQYIDLATIIPLNSTADNPPALPAPQKNNGSKTSVYSSFNPDEYDSTSAVTTPGKEQIEDKDLDISFDSVAEITFSDKSKNIETENKEPSAIASSVPQSQTEVTNEPEVKLYNNAETARDNTINKQNKESKTPDKITTNETKNPPRTNETDSKSPQQITHSKPQTIPLVEATESAASMVFKVVLKPAKRGYNKDIYINSNGHTMISMDYLIQSGLCSDCSVADNIIKINGPNGKLITINNIHKTMQLGNNKPIKFMKQARPYRTKHLVYYVPLRQVLEQAGYHVKWSSESKSVVVTK